MLRSKKREREREREGKKVHVYVHILTYGTPVPPSYPATVHEEEGVLLHFFPDIEHESLKFVWRQQGRSMQVRTATLLS